MYRPIPKLAVYISLLLTLMMIACMLISGAISRAAIRDEVQNTSLVYLSKLDDLYATEIAALKGVVSNFATRNLSDPNLAAKLRTDRYEHFTLKRSITELRREYPQIFSVDVFVDEGRLAFHSSAAQTAPNVADKIDASFYAAAVASRAFVYVSGLRTISEYAGPLERYEDVRVYSIAVRIPARNLDSRNYAVFNISAQHITGIAQSILAAEDRFVYLFDADMESLISHDQRTGAESALGREVEGELVARMRGASSDAFAFQYQLDGEAWWATGARFRSGRTGLMLVREAQLMRGVYITFRTLALCFLALLLVGFGCSLFIDRKFFLPVFGILNRAGLSPERRQSARKLPLTPNHEFDRLDDYICALARQYREQEKRIKEYFSGYRDNVLVSLLMGNQRAAAEFSRHGALMDAGYDGYLCALAVPDAPELAEEFAALGHWDRLAMPGGEIVYIVSLNERMTPEEIKARLTRREIAARVYLGDVQSRVEDIRRSYVAADKVAACAGGRAGVWTSGDAVLPPQAHARGASHADSPASRTDNTLSLVRQVVSYVDAHYMEDIGLGTIADYVYLSPSYLGRLFKEEVGLSFTNYIIKVRMEKAAELLANSNMMVSQVMERVGYFSIQGFSRVFRSFHDCSPSEYRKRIASQALSQPPPTDPGLSGR